MTTETTPATKTNTLAQDYAWVTHHLIALAIAASFILGGVYLTESLIAKHDQQNSDKWNSLLVQQESQTKVIQQQLAADENAAAARDAQYQKTIAQLAQTIVQRNATNAQQQKQDATLDTQQAAVRLANQTHAQTGEVVATDSGVSIDLPITRSIVGSLDLLPVVQSNLADTQNQLANETKLAADAQTDAAGQKNLASMYQEQLTTQTAACNATIKTLKAKQRKNIFKAVGIGIGVGIAIAARYL
jgi:hypothetical protein